MFEKASNAFCQLKAIERKKLNGTSKKIAPLIGASNFVKEMDSLIRSVSETNASVLLFGERGTGKRLIAQHIHFFASQNFGYFFEINCKSFNKEEILVAFDTVNKIVALDQRTTLFISFVDELPLDLQFELLNRIKSIREKGLNLKIISSVEQNLEEKVRDGSFRSDLFYQLNAVVLNVLPLRQRQEDIIPIAEYYLNQFKKKSGYEFEGFSDRAKKEMLSNFWIGNIDELVNSIQRGFIVGKLPVIKAEDLGITSNAAISAEEIESNLEDKSLKNALDNFKKEYVTKILEENGWNQTKTAKILGIQRTYVIRLINELQIRR